MCALKSNGFQTEIFQFQFSTDTVGIIPVQIMVAALCPLTKIIVIGPNSSFFLLLFILIGAVLRSPHYSCHLCSSIGRHKTVGLQVELWSSTQTALQFLWMC